MRFALLLFFLIIFPHASNSEVTLRISIDPTILSPKWYIYNNKFEELKSDESGELSAIKLDNDLIFEQNFEFILEIKDGFSPVAKMHITILPRPNTNPTAEIKIDNHAKNLAGSLPTHKALMKSYRNRGDLWFAYTLATHTQHSISVGATRVISDVIRLVSARRLAETGSTAASVFVPTADDLRHTQHLYKYPDAAKLKVIRNKFEWSRERLKDELTRARAQIFCNDNMNLPMRWLDTQQPEFAVSLAAFLRDKWAYLTNLEEPEVREICGIDSFLLATVREIAERKLGDAQQANLN